MNRKIKNIIYFSLVVISFVALSWTFGFYWMNLRGIGPVIKPPADDISDLLTNAPGAPINQTNLPLKLPEGFSISIFAKNLPGARVMEFDQFGNMWVSQTSEGKISMLEVSEGRVVKQNVLLSGLSRPHGLAFDPDMKSRLYIAEEGSVSVLTTYSEGGLSKIIDLPTSGGGHFTRTLGFGSDSKLYVSIGSSCNVCHERDSRRATIQVMDKDGQNLKEFAKGLRNSVFFTWDPLTSKMWATENSRDLLGDDMPPDEINIVQEGKNYGWPTCFGNNIHDNDFDENTYIRNPCMEPFEVGSHIDIQAHSAPLGLSFIPNNSNWPDAYEGDLLVALHGSWNRSEPTGYKIIRIKLDNNRENQGIEDFITGWLSGTSALGRPVDLKFGPDGALYVSDDKAGVVYKVDYIK